MHRLNQFGKYANDLATNFVWTNTYGVGRSLLALGLLVTLLFNDLEMLISPLGAEADVGPRILVPVAKLSLYELLPGQLILIKIISISVLTLVISGWRPRITGILHWWVVYSFTTSAIVVDGGDQIAQVLTILLIPICLADGRKWHWTKTSLSDLSSVPFYRKAFNLVAISTLFILQLQVAFIYFHASVGKMNVEEWINGTSIFYWIQDPLFGATSSIQPFLIAFFSHPYIVAITTWGVMIFELILFLGIAMNSRWKNNLLKAGIAFHFGIIILHGLVSFFFTMAAALVLYLGPKEGFDFLPFSNWLKKLTTKEKQFTEATLPSTAGPINT